MPLEALEKIAPILGVAIAAAVILAVPRFRRAIFKSHEAGNKAGSEAGRKLAENLKGNREKK